jgi:hypothetical protein
MAMSLSVESDAAGFFLGAAAASPTPPTADAASAAAAAAATLGVNVHPAQLGIFGPSASPVDVLDSANDTASLWPSGNDDVSDRVSSNFYNRMNCGHFATVGGKISYKADVVEDAIFWTEGVASLVFALFGLLGNAMSIWVLSAPEMKNSFNRLLMALAVIDCLFILPGVLIYSHKAFQWEWEVSAKLQFS